MVLLAASKIDIVRGSVRIRRSGLIEIPTVFCFEDSRRLSSTHNILKVKF